MKGFLLFHLSIDEGVKNWVLDGSEVVKEEEEELVVVEVHCHNITRG